MVEIIKNLCPSNKYSIKCPYPMTPEYITIHNTANDASAQNEVNYMLNNNNETSYHFAVDDKEIIQAIPLNRNAWHAGDGGSGTGNRKTIGIEICYSKSGGDRFVAAMHNAAELTASLLIKYGWGTERVKKHQDWSGKNCPHRILSDYGWGYFLNLVSQYLSGSTITPTAPVPQIAPNIMYAVYTAKNKWLSEVTNYNNSNGNGYAGMTGQPMQGIRCRLSSGSVVYRVHLIGGGWLDWVTDHEAAQGGYAGIYGKNIDGIQMYLKDLPDCSIRYRVKTVGGSCLDWVTNCNDTNEGYAGIYGKAIDQVQVYLVANPKIEISSPVTPIPPVEEVKPEADMSYSPVVPEKPENEPVVEENISSSSPETSTTENGNNGIEEILTDDDKNTIMNILKAIIDFIISIFKRKK